MTFKHHKPITKGTCRSSSSPWLSITFALALGGNRFPFRKVPFLREKKKAPNLRDTLDGNYMKLHIYIYNICTVYVNRVLTSILKPRSVEVSTTYLPANKNFQANEWMRNAAQYHWQAKVHWTFLGLKFHLKWLKYQIFRSYFFSFNSGKKNCWNFDAKKLLHEIWILKVPWPLKHKSDLGQSRRWPPRDQPTMLNSHAPAPNSTPRGHVAMPCQASMFEWNP